MGRRSSLSPAAPDSRPKAALLLALGIVLMVVGTVLALTFLGMLFFGGIDWFEEVGSTDSGTGPVVFGIAVACGAVAFGGFSLVKPALDRQHYRYQRFSPAALGRERIIVVASAVVLVVATVLSFIGQWTAAIVLLIGVAQFALAVYAFSRLRSLARGYRWMFISAAVLSLVANPLTLIAGVAIGYAVTGQSLS